MIGLAGWLDAAAARAALWLARAAAVLLAGLMLLTFFDVVGRAAGQPIVGAVEVTELLMGGIIYMALGLTTIQRGHIRVDILIMYLPSRARALLEVVAMGLSIVFAVLVSWQLWLRAADLTRSGDTTVIWEWPVWPVAWLMAVCSLTLVTGLAVHLARAVAAVARGEDGAA